MDKLSTEIHNKALKETAEKFDLTEKQVLQVLKMKADYHYSQINSLDLRKDLKEQSVRFLIGDAGVVFLNRVLLMENDRIRGHITEEEYQWGRIWFKRSFKYLRTKIKKYKEDFN